MQEKRISMEQYVITISRQFGSMGRSIAKELSTLLGIEFMDRDIVEATAKRMGLPVSVISDEEESMKLADKMMNATYDFNDFLKQMKQMKKLGAFEDILKLIPGVGNQLKDINIDPKQMARVEAIIYSMTEQERKNPDLINASRKNRIAKGWGCDIAEVNRLIKQFTDMRKMMKKFSNMDPRQMERMAAAMQRGGGNPMAGLGGMMGQGKKGKGKGRGGFRF